jgi:rhodanese-related sulfurtransferase/DNA-binding transcriptional ArsR family regulator
MWVLFNYSIEQLSNPMSMPCQEFRDAVFEQFARIGKAVAHRKRLELLDLLVQAERTVEVLAEAANIPLASTSQHLQALRAAGLVESRKEGLYVTYRIADPAVAHLLQALRVLAERRLADLETITRRFMEQSGDMEKLGAADLLARIEEGSVTVLDVRPPEEYEAGHIPGALSMPLKDLEAHLSQLPRDQQIVAYCRGRYCVLAVQAVRLLQEQGYQVAGLEDGMQGWTARGFAVACGANGGQGPGARDE